MTGPAGCHKLDFLHGGGPFFPARLSGLPLDGPGGKRFKRLHRPLQNAVEPTGGALWELWNRLYYVGLRICTRQVDKAAAAGRLPVSGL